MCTVVRRTVRPVREVEKKNFKVQKVPGSGPDTCSNLFRATPGGRETSRRRSKLKYGYTAPPAYVPVMDCDRSPTLGTRRSRDNRLTGSVPRYMDKRGTTNPIFQVPKR
jgi:hypothetical protein